MVVGALMILAGMLLVWFHIPYSPLKSKFTKDVTALQARSTPTASKLFDEKDFEHLPDAIRKYLKNSGYIGTPKMKSMSIQFQDVQFKQGKNGPSLIVDYTQYNFAEGADRLALIESSLFGIPFQGDDYYAGGQGGMQGVVGKAITLFHQTGEEMDRAALVTFLSESLFMPSVILQDGMNFEEISPYEVKATFSANQQTVSGVFKFNEAYEMVSFTTNNRAFSGTDGTLNHIPWSIIGDAYEYNDLGIKLPTVVQAVWHFEDEDFIYFDGKITELNYQN